MTVMKLVFENGVFRPVSVIGLKEHQQYEAVLREIGPDEQAEFSVDPALAAELERRTSVLPDGGTAIRLGGLFETLSAPAPDAADEWERALAELRQERERHFDEVWSVSSTSE